MVHQAGAYPSISNMKQLGVFLLPPGWSATPSQGYPPALSLRYPSIHLGGEGTVRVKCLAQEHNTKSPARAQNPLNLESTTLTMRPQHFPQLLCMFGIKYVCSQTIK